MLGKRVKVSSKFEPVHCSIFGTNCYFLTCIQISQEEGNVVWYFHLFKNLPQFVLIHTVKGFGVVNKAKVNVFLECSCFFNDPTDVGKLISGSSAFSKTSLTYPGMEVVSLMSPALAGRFFTSSITWEAPIKG